MRSNHRFHATSQPPQLRRSVRAARELDVGHTGASALEYDSLSEVADEPLSVMPETLSQLSSLKESERFELLPGIDTAAERQSS